jgi:hypothetical protein
MPPTSTASLPRTRSKPIAIRGLSPWRKITRRVTQLRGMFFRASFQDYGPALSDGAILGLAGVLSANDELRGQPWLAH